MNAARLPHTHCAARTAAAVLLTGIAAGVINGLLGTGGGILALLMLARWQRRTASDASKEDARAAYATSLAAMLPVSLLSLLQYTAKGGIDLSAFTPYLLPALAGGLVGGVLLDRVRLPLLRTLFAALLLFGGVRMLLG